MQFGSLAWDKTLECVYGIIYGLCTKPCIGSSSPPEFYSQTPGCLMLKPIFAGRDSNISSYLYGINRSIYGRCILLLVSMSYAQQILENRNISWFNVVELQCNQVDDWLGAPPEIPVIFGAYVYKNCTSWRKYNILVLICPCCTCTSIIRTNKEGGGLLMLLHIWCH